MTAKRIQEILIERGVARLLSSKSALVLERIACGGGQTCWYMIDKGRGTEELSALLRPGSCVSVYFGEVLFSTRKPSELIGEAMKFIEKSLDHECVVAARKGSDTRLCVEFVSGIGDLNGFLESNVGDDIVYLWGPYPGRDNDKITGFTFTLPDADGMVRQYPY
jgi:hypothetical protein